MQKEKRMKIISTKQYKEYQQISQQRNQQVNAKGGEARHFCYEVFSMFTISMF